MQAVVDGTRWGIAAPDCILEDLDCIKLVLSVGGGVSLNLSLSREEARRMARGLWRAAGIARALKAEEQTDDGLDRRRGGD